MSAKDTQVGGDHYRNLSIQPIDFITQNNLGFCEGNVVKYVSRWRSKGGVGDLRKARHYLDLLIESEEDTHQESAEEPVREAGGEVSDADIRRFFGSTVLIPVGKPGW